jgi:hypothetical protein
MNSEYTFKNDINHTVDFSNHCFVYKIGRFLVSEISISLIFFDWIDVQYIYEEYRTSMELLNPLPPKKGKNGKKRAIFYFLQQNLNFEKTMIFLRVYCLCTTSTLFVLFVKKS